MRRHDKARHIERVNILFEQRNLKESAFSWDGKYEGEEDLHEDKYEELKDSLDYGPDNDNRDSAEPSDWDWAANSEHDKKKDMDKFSKEIGEGMMSLGDDIENIEEEITNITTDVEASIFFSDEDGQRNTDGPSVG